MEPSFIKLYLVLRIWGQLIFRVSFSLAGRLNQPFLDNLPLGILPSDISTRRYFSLSSVMNNDSCFWSDWRCSCKAVLSLVLYSGYSFSSFWIWGCLKVSLQLEMLQVSRFVDLFPANFWSLECIGCAEREADDLYEASHLFFPLSMGQNC